MRDCFSVRQVSFWYACVMCKGLSLDLVFMNIQETLGERQKMTNNRQKEIQAKLARNLLDQIILQYLEKESMHGYQIITRIRKSYGVYFGPSTVYPLLAMLEKKGYVKSTWNVGSVRPRKVYSLTADGKCVLKLAEASLTMMCRSLADGSVLKAEQERMVLPIQESSQRTIICRS